MKRKEFMERLEMLLNDVSDREREEALQYYSDYFGDAGEENEDALLKDLESPEKVAAMIKTGLLEKEHSSGEYTERGYEDERFKRSYEMTPLENRTDAGNGSARSNSGAPDEKIVDTYKKADTGKIILIVILCILCIPFLIPAAGALIGVLVGAVGILVGCAAAAVGLIASGIAVFILGITVMAGVPMAGLCLLGAGLLLFGIGMVFLWLTVWLFGVALPFCIRGISGIISNLVHRRRKTG